MASVPQALPQLAHGALATSLERHYAASKLASCLTWLATWQCIYGARVGQTVTTSQSTPGVVQGFESPGFRHAFIRPSAATGGPAPIFVVLMSQSYNDSIPAPMPAVMRSAWRPLGQGACSHDVSVDVRVSASCSHASLVGIAGLRRQNEARSWKYMPGVPSSTTRMHIRAVATLLYECDRHFACNA